MNRRISELLSELLSAANPKKAQVLKRFFKTGKGDYGEGDVFLGITVPRQRAIAHRFLDLTLPALAQLLRSPVHEHRFTALEILVAQFEHGDAATQKAIYSFYLRHTDRIDNWDLVDTSAPYIVGSYLLSHSGKVLSRLARSVNLWRRRIAIVATFEFIKAGRFRETLAIAEILLHDKHDLIQKAVGWMLRELGKRDERSLENFLNRHSRTMPRTMLRYAIERLPNSRRLAYLSRENRR